MPIRSSPTPTAAPSPSATTSRAPLSRATGESVGPYAITQGDLALTSDYTITFEGADFAITPDTLVPSATVADRSYDATTDATILTRTLSGIHGLDDVTLVGGSALPTRTSASPVSVSGLSLAGADAGNYVLSSTNASATADITPFLLTITASADDKVYDGTTDAVAHLSDDHIFGDDLTTSHTSATLTRRRSGSTRSPSAIALAVPTPSPRATTASATADITNRLITVTPTSGQSKIFGDADPVFAYTYTGTLALGDDFTGALKPGHR